VSVLLFRVGKTLRALPTSNVFEVVRGRAVLSLSDTALFVMGVSAIRGEKVPVVDLGDLFGLGLTDPVEPVS
jgi:chemotaxis signal transduction protein